MQLRHPLTLAALLLVSPSFAGLFGKRTSPEPESEAPPKAQAERPKERHPVLPAIDAVFDDPLPWSVGPLPKGLANLSAQGCAACHSEAVASWSRSPHANRPSERLLQAAALAGRPDCLSCHLPLDVQHRTVVVTGQPSSGTSPNPAFDFGLSAESVTCAACHVREGHVVGARAQARPPHATRHSTDLSEASACASCHQLTWPGAQVPLYDTYGEWSRSGWAKAEVTCQDCHMKPSVLGSAPTHDVSLPLSQALSALVQLPGTAVVRGGEPVQGSLILQNTGAGHAIPTGSPFVGLLAVLEIEGPGGDGEERTSYGEIVRAPLTRTFAEEPAWALAEDTRLAAGGQRSLPLSIALPVDAPRGSYTLTLTLTRLHGEEAEPEPRLRRTWPLEVH